MTKFAMNAMDEALRLEVKKYGIDVSLVCPGLTATDFQTNAAKIHFEPLMKSGDGMKPDKVGEAIYKAVRYRKRVVPLTFQGKALWMVNKFFPRMVDRILLKMYDR
jgi:short-subunit dehydrogenase